MDPGAKAIADPGVPAQPTGGGSEHAGPALADPGAELLVAFLWHNHADCPRCGYDMHRAMAPVCPECGLALALQVTTPVPLIRQWLVLSLPLLLSAGVGVVLIWATLVNGVPHEQGMGFWYCYSYFIATVPLAALALRCRRGFMALPAALQSLAALASIALALIAYGIVLWQFH